MRHADYLNETHVKNLETLSAFLKVHVPPPEFTMAVFAGATRGAIDKMYPDWPVVGLYAGSLEREICEVPPSILTADPKVYTSPECGTVACAVGHGPLAGIPALEGESWHNYALRNFGTRVYSSSAFTWMFGSAWAKVDDTPKGAAARIDWYLEHGAPDDYADQMFGRSPLCYSTDGGTDGGR